MEYDFSKIKTEELREAVEIYNKGRSGLCRNISCESCPIGGFNTRCGMTYSPKNIYTIFKEEINRREKMENKMPELEAGMIVEFGNGYGIVMPMGSERKTAIYDLSKGNAGGNSFGDIDILKIYFKKHSTYINLFKGVVDPNTLELIWSKKSDKDIKIEELEATIKKAQEQIQELKG